MIYPWQSCKTSPATLATSSQAKTWSRSRYSRTNTVRAVDAPLGSTPFGPGLVQRGYSLLVRHFGQTEHQRPPRTARPARTRSGFARLSPIATGARSHVHILGLSRHKTPAKRVAFSCGFVLVNFYRVPRVHEYKT
jgi:hypothetical protein